jgi:threonine synthase
MQFFSLDQRAPEVSFQEAAMRGLAPDRGLYFPKEIPVFPEAFWKGVHQRPFQEVAFELMKAYTGDSLPDRQLWEILEATLDFEFPLVWLDTQIGVLELYHGPTMAFKDVGAAFMAGCLGYFSRRLETDLTVLVATSGDTGGAVANGFLGVPGTEVVILYPEGKVSDIQERQLTTLGQNIRALRVDGTFDDCQDMVKKAFLDPGLREKRNLTSANSINVARWLPQLLYYVRAYQQMDPTTEPPVFSVPSGNFGNICAGILAWRMGMPCEHFVAATNVNDTVPRYMDNGDYQPEPVVTTLSNAMDVADPSNFVRVQALFHNDLKALKARVSSYAYDDHQTLGAIEELHKKYGYIADPHGAVGYLGLQEYREWERNGPGIFLETAHPIKFRQTVEDCLWLSLEAPEQLGDLLRREKKFVPIKTYEELREYLL